MFNLFKKIDEFENLKASYEKVILKLTKERDEARDLKEILEKLTKKSEITGDLVSGFGLVSNNYSDGGPILSIDEDKIPVYVNDYFGGKYIKQESTKLVELDPTGKATYHFTEQKADKGFSYKLIQK